MSVIQEFSAYYCRPGAYSSRDYRQVVTDGMSGSESAVHKALVAIINIRKEAAIRTGTCSCLGCYALMYKMVIANEQETVRWNRYN